MNVCAWRRCEYNLKVNKVSDNTITVLAVGVMAVILALGVTVCMVIEHSVNAEVVTLLGTLAGVLIGGHALSNGVKKINGNGGK